MTELFIIWSILLSQILIGAAMLCALVRMVRGPRAQDRISASMRSTSPAC